jgi:hypothetical protein
VELQRQAGDYGVPVGAAGCEIRHHLPYMSHGFFGVSRRRDGYSRPGSCTCGMARQAQPARLAQLSVLIGIFADS